MCRKTLYWLVAFVTFYSADCEGKPRTCIVLSAVERNRNVSGMYESNSFLYHANMAEKCLKNSL